MTATNLSTNDDDGLESVLEDDEGFQESALYVQTHHSLFSRDDLLYLYARYKQVTVGDVNTPRPGYFSFEAKTKWEAWDAIKSMSKSQASQEYIQRVTDIQQKQVKVIQKAMNVGPSVSRFSAEDDEKPLKDDKKTIYELCQDGNEKLVEQMLKKNFDVNKPDDMQLTLLHWAADRGNESMIRLLFKYGANLDARDEDGQTPLFYASHAGSIDCIKLLLASGANPSIPNNDGELPSSAAQTDKERAIWKECQ